jgi:hypothetical protein
MNTRINQNKSSEKKHINDQKLKEGGDSSSKTTTSELGMLKSKTRDKKKFMLIKNMLNNMYQETSLEKDNKEEKKEDQKEPVKSPKKQEKGVEEVEEVKEVKKDEMVKEISKRQSNVLEQEQKMIKDSNMILLFDDSSTESTILGRKIKEKDIVKSSNPSVKEKEKKKEEDKEEKKSNKDSQLSVKHKYSKALIKLETKIMRTEYYTEKMKKLNSHWDEARYDINKYTGSKDELIGLYEYLKQRNIKLSQRPSKMSRLRLNRINFMIQKITPRPSRNYEQFSLFESYLILKLFVLPQNQPQTQFDTEAVVQILSDYLGREKQSIYSQKENLENNTKFVNMVDFVEYLLFEHLQEDAQDFKFGRETDIIQIFEKEGTGVIRFSFLVDIFLLHFYILYNVTNFIDKMDMVIKIINALTNNSDFEIPQKYKMKTKWIKRVYYRTTKSKKRFITDYEFMILHEHKYIEMIHQFEKVIISKGWKSGLILTTNALTDSNDSPKIQPSINETEIKSVSEVGSEEDFTDDMFKKYEKPVTRKSMDKLSENIDISQATHNYFLSKKELDLEKSNKALNLKKVLKSKSITNKTFPGINIVETNKQPLSKSDICFLNFGMEYIKNNFDMREIEVEELTVADKETLMQLMYFKVDTKYLHLQSMLKILMKQVSTNLKEFLRNADITLKCMKDIDIVNLDSKFAILLTHVYYKIEKIIEFIRKITFKTK